MPRPPRRVAGLKAARTLKPQGHSQTSATPSTPSKGETAAMSATPTHKRPRTPGAEEHPVKKQPRAHPRNSLLVYGRPGYRARLPRFFYLHGHLHIDLMILKMKRYSKILDDWSMIKRKLS